MLTIRRQNLGWLVCVSVGTLCFLLYVFSRQISHTKKQNLVESSNPQTLLVEDLGNVEPKSQTQREVVIKNSSFIAWTLDSIRSDCGCLVNKVEPARIEPGKEGTLSVMYNAPDSVGAINRKVIVSFREESAPVYRVTIKGFVHPWCYAIPQRVDFGTVIEGEKDFPGRTLLLKIRAGHFIDWDHSPQAPDWLEVKHLKLTGDYREVQLRPVFHKPPQLGLRSGVVVFFSKDSPQEKITVPVSVSVEPSLVAKPKVLFLGEREIGERFTTKVSISGKCLSPQIDGALTSGSMRVTHDLGEHLDVEKVSGKTSREIDLKCHFAMPESKCLFDGKIIILYPGRQSITIPVIAKVNGQGSGKE